MILGPCTACRRHVRLDEPSCPFCGGVVPAAPTTPEGATPRLSRSALAALGAIGVGLGLAGCPTPVAALYGGPPTPKPEPTASTSESASPSGSASPSPTESPSAVPTPTAISLYGAPPVPKP